MQITRFLVKVKMNTNIPASLVLSLIQAHYHGVDEDFDQICRRLAQRLSEEDKEKLANYVLAHCC